MSGEIKGWVSHWYSDELASSRTLNCKETTSMKKCADINDQEPLVFRVRCFIWIVEALNSAVVTTNVHSVCWRMSLAMGLVHLFS